LFISRVVRLLDFNLFRLQRENKNNEYVEKKIITKEGKERIISWHNVLLHEIGETEAGKLLGTQWKDMLNDIPRSKTELQMRTVRDHLADCLSTLPSLIEEEKLG